MCLITDWLPMTSILFGIERICSSLLKVNYLKNKKHFIKFLFRWWNLHQIFQHFRKKDDRDSWCISEITECQNVVRPLSKKRRFRTSFDSQLVKGFQTFVKWAWEHFCHIFLLLWSEITWKISPLLDFEILGVFVNTLTAEENCPFGDYGDLQFPA